MLDRTVGLETLGKDIVPLLNEFANSMRAN